MPIEYIYTSGFALDYVCMDHVLISILDTWKMKHAVQVPGGVYMRWIRIALKRLQS